MKKKNKMKIKEITWDEFRNVMSLNWGPVELTEHTVPYFLNNLVKSKNCKVYASGITGT